MLHKSVFTVLFTICALVTGFTQGVGINESGSSPDPSSILDVHSADKGVLIPRMTTAERNAISNPAEGLHIYNTETHCFNVYNGTSWRQSCYECDFALPSIGNSGPVCEGSSLNLFASLLSGATYEWTGPNGFSSSLQNPVVANATTAAAGVYTLHVTLDGCTSSGITTVATVNETPDTPTPSNSGPVCEDSSVSFSSTSVLGATYSWTGPNGFSSNAQNPEITGATPSNGGNYSVVATVNGCSSTAGSTNLVVHATPVIVASSNAPVCPGATLSLASTFIEDATYSWTGPNDYSSSAQNPAIANVNSGHQGSYSVVATANGCVGPASSVSVIISDGAPSIPGTITGPAGGFSGMNATYSITAVGQATSYNWTVPSGTIILSGQGTTSINVNLGSNDGSVCVTASNSCGTSAQQCLSVNVCSGSSNWLINNTSFTQNNTTYASSNLSTSSYPPTKIVDGSVGNGSGRWVSGQSMGMPQWIAFNLGSSYTVDEFRMWNLHDDHANQGAKDFKVQTATSINGPWTDVLTAQAAAQSSSWQTYTLPVPATSQFWRVYVTSVWDSAEGWVQIMEVGWKGCQ